MNDLRKGNRIFFLDELRGFAVFCMVFYHGFFIIGDYFGLAAANWLFDFFTPVEPAFAGLFIAICGISCSLSSSNAKRGLILFGISLGLSLVTILILPLIGMEGLEIRFGILHFLSVCILLYALAEKKLKKIPVAAGLVACAMLYPFTSGIENGVLSYGELFVLKLPDFLYKTDWLMPLGMYSDGFYSGDYFPVFPGIFIFLAGVFIGFYFTRTGFPEWSYKKRSRFFAFLGRRSLIIYIAHMPVIFGAAYVIDYIINGR